MTLMPLGIIRFFSCEGFGGLWLAFIGWFLFDAASSTYAQADVAEELRGICVSDVMSRDCPTVDKHTPFQTFVEGNLLRTGQRCFMVVDN